MKASKIILPFFVLALGALIAYFILKNPPKPKKTKRHSSKMIVKAMTLEEKDYQTWVQSQGRIQASHKSKLSAEVSGTIIKVYSNLFIGSIISKDELLYQIDPRDYDIKIQIAKAKVAQAKVQLEEEKAKSKQALVEWERSGLKQKASDFLLRKPQLQHARAHLKASRAELKQAKLQRSRTEIRAPFNAIIQRKYADLGQYLRQGSDLLEISSTEHPEIRLPLSQTQYQHLTRQSNYRDKLLNQLIPVKLTQIGQPHQWNAVLIRDESMLDSSTLEHVVVARLMNDTTVPSLPLESFVQAKIQGPLLKSVFVLPISSLTNQDKIFLIDHESKLKSLSLQILWKNAHQLITKNGLQNGDQVCITTLKRAIDGTAVSIQNLQTKSKKSSQK